MVKKVFKVLGITLLCLILAIAIIVGTYAIYLSCQYYRIQDNQVLEITNNKQPLVATNSKYSISTYNIGFGAYAQNFSFFMDTGTMLDGTEVAGTSSRAISKENVEFNTAGAMTTIAELNPDFMFFQEVDTDSHRSYFVNQYESLQSAFTDYSSSFAVNFHSGYLFYPITNPIGTCNSGIATMSKYNIENSTRKTFPIDESFINKFFDLDRCFVVNRLPIEGSDKELVLINLHMSAYDEGGVYRTQQLELLCDFIATEYAAGNYVIAGGDWNQDIADTIDYFPSNQLIPEWVFSISPDELPQGFSFATARNVPTCRGADIPYKVIDKSQNYLENYSVVIDGFLVSDNIQVVNVTNIDTDFMYSDHNPVYMEFILN